VKLSEIRDNLVGGICAGVTGAFASVGAPIAIVAEMAEGKSFSDAVEATGEGLRDLTSSAFEWGKENGETAAQVTGIALGVSGVVARHNAKHQNNSY
jgi:hypothetical protein